MLNGQLTPLGRSLHRVVINFSPHPYWNESSYICAGQGLGIRKPHNVFKGQYGTAVASTIVSNSTSGDGDSRITGIENDRIGRHGRSNTDWITEALHATRGGQNTVARSSRKLDLSNLSLQDHINCTHYRQSSRMKQRAPTRLRNHAVSFRSILARYLKYFHARQNAIRHGRILSEYALTARERAILDADQKNLDDVHDWAMLLRERVLPTALRDLYDRTQSLGPSSGSLVVLSYLLRRADYSPKALSFAIDLTILHLEHGGAKMKLGFRRLFLLFLRLIRHARMHAPSAIPTISAMILKSIASQSSSDTAERKQGIIRSLTFSLNKALYLICLPTSIEPFKNAVYQEQAVIQILRYMADHNPTIQLNRTGYRAVVTLQLTFGKTNREKQWARLKALSWPPWKVDRTQIDAKITHRDAGISRAGETLRRMREAGYAPLDWEKTAHLYAGWDTDETPVIQTRVLMQQARGSQAKAALWVARITTTRTIQEAWAAYLAYEHNHSTPHHDVLQAVFQKLHQESQRRQLEQDHPQVSTVDHDDEDVSEPVQAGDSREISPLPSSIHLHTHTHTAPPSLSEFYVTLRQRDVTIGLGSLELLVKHAPSLEVGMSYIHDAESWLPAAAHLFSPHGTRANLAKIPKKLFQAYIILLCRFPGRSVQHSSMHNAAPSTHSLGMMRLSPNIAIGHAIHLVQQREAISRSLINVVLDSLSKDATVKAMTKLLHSQDSQRCSPQKSAVIGYKLARELIGSAERRHQELDQEGLLCFYRIIENAITAVWQMALHEDLPEDDNDSHSLTSILGYNDAVEHALDLFMRVGGYHDALDSSRPPMNFPAPAVWHALVRVTGLAGSFEHLAQVMRLMACDIEYLGDVVQRHRNGPRVVQRTIRAARVLLERRWLPGGWPGRQESPLLKKLVTKAPETLITEVRALFDESYAWLNWPSERRADVYWKNSSRFLSLRSLYDRKP